MAHLNHFGPENNGPKTGRMLGECTKTEAELLHLGTIGLGQGKQRHSQGNSHKGKGKRINYLKATNIKH